MKGFLGFLSAMLLAVIFQSVYATDDVETKSKVNNMYFTMDPLDNWRYAGSSDTAFAKMLGFGPSTAVNLAPSQYSSLILDQNKSLSEKMQNEGAYATFKQDVDYPLKNSPLDAYVKYKIDYQYGINVTTRSNETIDGEKATRISANGIGDFDGTNFVEYMMIHNGDPYYIGYMANSNDFDKYLPQFEQMVRSFKFAIE